MTHCRFLAVSTRSQKAKKVEVPPGTTKVQFGALTIWLAAGCRFILFENLRGILVGDLFDHAGTSVGMIDRECAESIESTMGSHLVRKYWGQYCCFFLDGQERVISIRDPSGGLGCYYYEDQENLWQSSLVDDLIGAQICDGAIDPVALGRHLVRTQLREARSSLCGITEMLRGERLNFGRDGTKIDSAWLPWDFVRLDRAWTFEDAAAAVKAETLRAIRAQAARFEHLLVDISGGLDSSILAAGLKAAGATATLITFESGAPRDDERPFAREVARHLDYSLIEAKLEIGDIDLARSACGHLPRPIARSFAQSSDATCRRIAAQVGCDASFNGAGGDNVFFNSSTADPIVERIQVWGGRAGLLQTVRDVSRMTQTSMIDVLRYAWRRWKKRNDPIFWARDLAFLADDVASGHRNAEHPWLHWPGKTTQARRAHVAMLMRIENHLEGFERELSMPVVSPLLSQPLVELCLSIPSWLWVRGGANRAVARRAFQDLLPPKIIERRGHGSPIGFAAALFDQRRAALLSLLMDGWMAQQRIIDATAVERYLSNLRPPKDLRFLRILELADVEAWARSREERRGSSGIFQPLLQGSPMANVLG